MFQFGGSWSFVWGGLSPQKPPRGDGTGTVYGGLFSENLNHVWASQVILTMYEIEK